LLSLFIIGLQSYIYCIHGSKMDQWRFNELSAVNVLMVNSVLFKQLLIYNGIKFWANDTQLWFFS
jgi:hypothetical protein